MKQVKVGIVGLGFMGTTHWGVYGGMKNAKVVALADVDAKKRKGDMSLYKEYQQNDGFKANFQNLLIRMVENMDYL